jgi:hypothetical protein
MIARSLAPRIRVASERLRKPAASPTVTYDRLFFDRDGKLDLSVAAGVMVLSELEAPA